MIMKSSTIDHWSQKTNFKKYEQCVKVKALRYYIKYDNDEDMARALLILFLPFRDEMNKIHNWNVKQLLHEKQDMINEKEWILKNTR